MKQASKVKVGLLAILLAGGSLSCGHAYAQHGGGHFGGGPGGGHFGGPGGGWHGGGPGGWGGGGGWRGGGPWGGGGRGWGWGWGGWGGYYGGWYSPYYYGGYGGYGGWNPYWGGNPYWSPYWAGWGWGWSMPYAYGRMADVETYSGSYPQYNQAPPATPDSTPVQQGDGQSIYAPPSYYASPDYGQYPASTNTMPPPANMPGSDGTAMFKCKDGYFYNNLTQNCDKR